jgi:hypothetical protein
MKKRPEEVTPEALRTFGSFPYFSGTGKCVVMHLGGSRPFGVYLIEENGPPRLVETHQTQKNAEAVARWMAMGL